MNLLTLDTSTMSGMSDEHFVASVEPLLMTPLERELFKRLYESTDDNYKYRKCLEGLQDDCLYLKDLVGSKVALSKLESMEKNIKEVLK
mgnify:CR=1 FL=1